MTGETKTVLFEEAPVAEAVMKLAIPTMISSLVMVIYNLSDTYFVGMINDPVQRKIMTRFPGVQRSDFTVPYSAAFYFRLFIW